MTKHMGKAKKKLTTEEESNILLFVTDHKGCLPDIWL